MTYTEEQIKELEDVIFNALLPIYAYVEMYTGTTLPKEKANIMLSRMHKIKDFIRNLRPTHKRYK